MTSATVEVLGLIGFALAFIVLAVLLLRGRGDLPPGYGTPGSGRRDRRSWAFTSLFMAAGCVVLAVMSAVMK
jgi:hypothetical protein